MSDNRDPGYREIARDTAEDMAEGVRGAARPLVQDAVGTLSFILLAVLMVPVGIVIVALGFFAMALASRALGTPTGTLASVIMLGGLLAILAALFFSFRALYRRMPRGLRAAYAAPMRSSGPDLPVSVPRTPPPPTPTLAELDARLAPRPPASDSS